MDVPLLRGEEARVGGDGHVVEWRDPSGSVSAEEAADPFSGMAEGDAAWIASPAWNQRRSRRLLVCAGVGLVLSIAVAIALPLVIRDFVANGVRGNVVIDSEKADGFKQFANRGETGDNYLEFFMFDIINPHDILEGEKPHVEELGPWVYRMEQVREDMEWSHQNDTLSYREHSFLVFDREETLSRTGGRFRSDDVEVTTVNLVFWGMEYVLGRSLWYDICTYFKWTDEYSRVFTKRTVREILTGYKIHVAGFIPVSFPGLFPNLTKNVDPNYKFKTTMRVGENDMNEVYELVKWREMESVRVTCPYGVNPIADCPAAAPCCCDHEAFDQQSNIVPVWGTEIVPGVWDSDANKVHGRDGEQFSPGTKPGSYLKIFNDLIWRTLLFVNKENEQVVFKGIRMLRFRPDESTFMNSTERPANARYYQFGPYGFLGNLSMTQQGVPIIASLPHFLGADPEVIQAVKGLNPDKEKHAMTIDVEPILGQTMVERVRAQVSMPLRPIRWDKGPDWFPRMRNVYLPIGWFEQVSLITDKGVDEFKILYIAHDISIAATMGGVFLALFFAYPILDALRFHYFVVIPHRQQSSSDA